MCLACAVPFPSVTGPASRGPFPPALEPFPFPDGKPCGATLRWTGVAGFVFEAQGARIAFDPFVTRPGLFATLLRRARSDEAAVNAALSDLDAVFVGHTHYDHAMDVPAVLAASPRATLYGSTTTVEACRRLGSDPARLRPVRDGDSVSVGPFRVTVVKADHGIVPVVRHFDRLDLPSQGLPGTPFRWPRGEVFAYRVEVLGRSFHIQGSAGIDDAALARQSPCDVLIACLAARKGTSRYLERLGERLKPKVLVPCHHDDFFSPLSEPARPIATLRWEDFLGEADRLHAAYGTALWLPVRGATAPI